MGLILRSQLFWGERGGLWLTNCCDILTKEVTTCSPQASLNHEPHSNCSTSRVPLTNNIHLHSNGATSASMPSVNGIGKIFLIELLESFSCLFSWSLKLALLINWVSDSFGKVKFLNFINSSYSSQRNIPPRNFLFCKNKFRAHLELKSHSGSMGSMGNGHLKSSFSCAHHGHRRYFTEQVRQNKNKQP